MTYIQDAIKAVNAELPGLVPRLARLYALLALTTGKQTTPEDVHHAWALLAPRHHPRLVPAAQLSAEDRERNWPIAAGIRRVARQLRQRPAVPVNPAADLWFLTLPKLAPGERLRGNRRASVAKELRRHYEQGCTIQVLADATGYGYYQVLDAGTPIRRGGAARSHRLRETSR